MNPLWLAIADTITAHTRAKITSVEMEPVSGGCINECLRLVSDQGIYFVKVNRHVYAHRMFQCEAMGLAEMATTNGLEIPAVICLGEFNNGAFLVLEHLDLRGRHNPVALAEGLAQMHRSTQPRYGWHEDNFIGSAPQVNSWSTCWESFWWECRLEPQLSQARNQYSEVSAWVEKAYAINHALLQHHCPEPSLLHGDLWQGNVGFTTAGKPAVYDPACYYGDREADVAMTRLFGGFSAEFYRAYENAWPLESGAEIRFQLYNFYHLLNHLNLFGRSYLAQCQQTLELLSKEI